MPILYNMIVYTICLFDSIAQNQYHIAASMCGYSSGEKQSDNINYLDWGEMDVDEHKDGCIFIWSSQHQSNLLTIKEMTEPGGRYAPLSAPNKQNNGK